MKVFSSNLDKDPKYTEFQIMPEIQNMQHFGVYICTYGHGVLNLYSISFIFIWFFVKNNFIVEFNDALASLNNGQNITEYNVNIG